MSAGLPEPENKEAIGLLRRLVLATDAPGACQRLLGHLLRTTPAERALVLVRHEGRLHVEGVGFEPEVLKQAAREHEPTRVWLEEAVDGGAPRSVGPGEAPGELGEGPYALVPFPGPGGVPSGCVLVEGADDEIGGLSGWIDLMGPLLVRVHATDVVKERVRRMEGRDAILSAVVETLADPVVLTDHNNDFVYANQRAENLFATHPQDSEGRRRAVQVNDLLFSSFLTQAVISQEATPRELNLVDPADGSDLLFEVMSVPMPQGIQEEGATISVLRDITDLKQAVSELEIQFNRSRVAEQAARRESDRLNVIIGSAGEPILVTDSESKIILMNQEAERLFEDGSEADHARKRNARAVRANDTQFTTFISDFLLQDVDRREEDLVLADPESGDDLPVEVISTKIRTHRGEVSAIVSVVRDRTQLVENERLAWELRKLNEGLEERVRQATAELEERNRQLEWQSRELEKASRLKSEFLASMSHEVRTPINAMIGYTALVQEEIHGPLTDGQRDALNKVDAASKHLLALINDILDLSKIEAGRMSLELEEVDLPPVVQDICQTIEPMVQEKGLELTVDLADDIPVLRTDRTRLKQVLLNLLSNAVKFTDEGSVALRLHLTSSGDRLRIEVEDTGIGMAEEHLADIFDDFRQVDQSSTRRFGGTGLGLSITRKLVRLMQGDIDVESEPGEGSTFSVEFPVRIEQPGELEPFGVESASVPEGAEHAGS